MTCSTAPCQHLDIDGLRALLARQYQFRYAAERVLASCEDRRVASLLECTAQFSDGTGIRAAAALDLFERALELGVESPEQMMMAAAVLYMDESPVSAPAAWAAVRLHFS